MAHEVLPLEEITFDEQQHTWEVQVLVEGQIRRGYLLQYHVYMAMIIRQEIELARLRSLTANVHFQPTTGYRAEQKCIICLEEKKECGNYCLSCNNCFICYGCLPTFEQTQFSRADLKVEEFDARSQKANPIVMQCPACRACTHIGGRIVGEIGIKFAPA
jgi:hypothetical protein